MELISYRGWPLALALPDRVLPTALKALAERDESDPLVRFACALALYAFELHAGLSDGPFDQARAERYARELLMPAEDFGPLVCLKDAELRSCLASKSSRSGRRRDLGARSARPWATALTHARRAHAREKPTENRRARRRAVARGDARPWSPIRQQDRVADRLGTGFVLGGSQRQTRHRTLIQHDDDEAHGDKLPRPPNVVALAGNMAAWARHELVDRFEQLLPGARRDWSSIPALTSSAASGGRRRALLRALPVGLVQRVGPDGHGHPLLHAPVAFDRRPRVRTGRRRTEEPGHLDVRPPVQVE
jgi:hypothetical protein